MKPAWETLMGDFKDHASALVADVDCTAEGKPLCDSNGVQGFPTIKWGAYGSMEDYQGGRTYDDLKKFADENLKPACGPANLDLCDDEKKAEIEKIMALSDDDIATQIEEGEQKMKDADTTFEEAVKELQATYEGLQKTKEAALAEVKASGLGLMKSVKAAKSKAAKDEL